MEISARLKSLFTDRRTVRPPTVTELVPLSPSNQSVAEIETIAPPITPEAGQTSPGIESAPDHHPVDPPITPQVPPPPPAYQTPAERIRATNRFEVGDIDLLSDTFQKVNEQPGTAWDDFRGSILALPEWFRQDLDPMSREYADQQRRLWGVISGITENYDPHVNEQHPPAERDVVRFPAYFLRRDALAVDNAGDHVLATGMILKRGGVRPGQWALEYGAGFAQTALHLARLGVNVDTVDISEDFCRYVKLQADFFKVPLTSFHGTFGWNPRGDQKYNLIWFYESFHHCTEFRELVHQLRQHLAPGGKVVLAGEPIHRRENPTLPYPWGLRLAAACVAVVRLRSWFELGFSEDFVVNLFTAAGFTAERMVCNASQYGDGYIFHHRGDRIELGKHWMPILEGATWHGPDPAGGSWTRAESYLTLDATDTFTTLEIVATNHHPCKYAVDMIYGDLNTRVRFNPGERKTFVIDASVKSPRLRFRTNPITPAHDRARNSPDKRALGIFVHEIRYR